MVPLWLLHSLILLSIHHFSGGYLANSLAIVTDAAHLMSDFAGFMISLLALWIATKPATTTLSFGWHRAGTREWQGVMGFDLEGLGRGTVAERRSTWLSNGHIYKVLPSLIFKGRWNRKRQPLSVLTLYKEKSLGRKWVNLRYFFAWWIIVRKRKPSYIWAVIQGWQIIPKILNVRSLWISIHWIHGKGWWWVTKEDLFSRW